MLHEQCLVDFQDRARNDPALNFSCPQCRSPLSQHGLGIISRLNLRPSPRQVDMNTSPVAENVRRLNALRQRPGMPGSPLPRIDAFCCPLLLHHRSSERRVMELTWAPDFDSQGNVIELARMCEGCNEPLRWDDCVAAADFDISNEYLEQIGNCPDHREVSPMFRVHRASGRLSV